MKTRLLPWLLMLASVLLLSGCAGFSFQTRFDHENDLLAKRGEPTRVWENEDGTRTLEYATQPMGETCWMYTVDDTGRVIEQHDALTRRNLDRVQRGMTVDEVSRMLGEHRSVQRFPRLNEEVRDWNVPNEWTGVIATFFNVHFVEGRVDRTSFSYIYMNDGDGGGLGLGWWGHPFGPRWHYAHGHRHGFGYHHPFGYRAWGGSRIGFHGFYGW
jgi:hypothetical protein